MRQRLVSEAVTCRASFAAPARVTPVSFVVAFASVQERSSESNRDPLPRSQTVVDAPDPALVRRIAEVLDAAVPQPWVGRQLFGLFKRAGLHEVRVVPHAICFSGAAGFAVYQQLNQGTIDRAVQSGQVAADEVAAWWAVLTRAAEAETFFSVVLGFIVAGRKP